MSLIISDPSHLFLTCFALPLRLFTTFCLSHFLLNAWWALWAFPYLLFYCHAEVTILRCLKSSPCKWFSSLIFSKYCHKGLTSFYSVLGIYLFFKMPCNFLFLNLVRTGVLIPLPVHSSSLSFWLLYKYVFYKRFNELSVFNTCFPCYFCFIIICIHASSHNVGTVCAKEFLRLMDTKP